MTLANRLAAVLLSIIVLGTVADTASAQDRARDVYPKPSPYPVQWELEFKPGDLRLYVDPQSGQPYWYFTYIVTNRTGDDQVWAPSFTLFTDAGQILPSGRDVPTRVTENLLELLDNEFLESQNQIIGEIFQGRENAREGLLLWPARELDVTEVKLFIAGLSGETAEVRDPITGDRVILRKTLQRNYVMPGNINLRRSEAARFVDQTWILR